MIWAAGGSGAAPMRDARWDTPTVLAQVTPPGSAEEGGEDEEEEFDPSDTLGVEEDEPLSPDSTQTAPPPSTPSTSSPDTALTAPPDTSQALPSGPTLPDTTARTPAFVPSVPDSATRARRAAAAADSGDTLMSAKPRQAPPAGPAPEAKKPRSGILGVHPIAILLGLAVLHYFVTKTAGD